ncbi:MAG: hypothetical protein JST59_15960, partial [Actinobacteria bacterium]|nr:hypothetical protein [Actinomycetota bacterium]
MPEDEAIDAASPRADLDPDDAVPHGHAAHLIAPDAVPEPETSPAPAAP